MINTPVAHSDNQKSKTWLETDYTAYPRIDVFASVLRTVQAINRLDAWSFQVLKIPKHVSTSTQSCVQIVAASSGVRLYSDYYHLITFQSKDFLLRSLARVSFRKSIIARREDFYSAVAESSPGGILTGKNRPV